MAGERICDWYSGRSVLVTGGTGFMGKVLIEKLLRCCPDIGTVYVLCRHKYGKTPITRLAELIMKPTIFDKLKKDMPSALNKLVAIDGDVEQDGVVLKDADREKIINQVSIVFHFAASLKLEATLGPAVEANTRGTLRMLQFSKNIRQLKLFVHLSTAFCHCEIDVLEEKYYPPPRDPYEIIKMVSTVDTDNLQAMTPGVLGDHPNCYTLSKRLAETLVNEYSRDIPAIIVRPSIVTPAMYEPVPGWVDSLNGPIGILVGAAKGVIRSMLCNPNNTAETVPVDIAVNAIISIVATSHKIDKCERTNSGDVPCYNISSGQIVPVTWGQVLERGKKQFYRYPFEAGLWYPGGTIRTNPYTHALAVLFFQTIPAYFIDFLMIIFRQKRFLVRIQKRISVGLGVLQYFTTRKWDFRIDRGVHQQIKLMHPDDSKIFYIDNVDKDVDQYLLKAILGARQYCVKEPLSTLTKARIQLWLLFFLDLSLKIAIYYMIYIYVSSSLEMINPAYKLPQPSLQWFDYLQFKT